MLRLMRVIVHGEFPLNLRFSSVFFSYVLDRFTYSDTFVSKVKTLFVAASNIENIRG